MILLGVSKYNKTVIDTKQKESEEELKPFIKRLDECFLIVKLDNNYNLIEVIKGETTQEDIDKELIRYKEVKESELLKNKL